jgi:Bacterial regulatory protein, Fis family
MSQLPDSLARQALAALKKHKGNQSAAARSLGLHRHTFLGRVAAAKRKKIDAGHLTVKGAPEDAAKTKKLADKLHAQVMRLTQAKKFKLASPAKRHGKDDILHMFVPDIHGHYHDRAAFAACTADMKRLQPDRVTQLGDFIDCGGFLAAHHVIGYMAQMEYSYEQDIMDGNGMLDQWQRDCPRTEFEVIEGNHEDRVERWCIGQALGSGKDADYLRRAFAPQYLLNLKNRGINYYRRSECYDGLPIPGAIKRGKIIVVHDPGFSDPRRTLSRFGAPVVHGHDHQSHANVTSTVGQGDIGVWAFGCLAQRQQLYAHSRPTGHVHGYGIALQSRAGHFLMISVPIIDGVSYLGKAFT